MPVIELEKIKLGENIRLEMNEQKMEELMASIKANGLIHPIAITRRHELVCGYRRVEAFRRLGRSEIPYVYFDGDDSAAGIVIANAEENLKREEITPFELAQVIQKLMDKYKMTMGQISVRLGLPLTRLKLSYQAGKHIPKEYHPYIGVGHPGQRRNGNIPLPIAIKLNNIKRTCNLTKEQFDQLFQAAREEGFVLEKAMVAGKLMSMGWTFDKAMKAALNMRIAFIRIPYDPKYLEGRMKAGGYRNIQRFFEDIIYGKSKPLEAVKQ